MTNRILCKKLWDARTSIGMTLGEAGERSGVASYVIGGLEKGKYIPKLDILEALAKAYHQPLDVFLDDDKSIVLLYQPNIEKE